MKTNPKLIATGLRAAALAAVIGLSVPAFAHAEGDSGSSGSGTSGTSHTETHIATTEPIATTSDTDQETNDTGTDRVKAMVDKFKKEGKDATKDELRSKESSLLKEKRQKVCENRKKAIDNRVTHTEALAQRHLDKLDSFYVKVKAFKDSKNLTVANYDTLTAAVDAAQADATATVAALKTVSTTIDCTSQNVADAVGAYRAALGATRDSLKTYRTALVDLVKAVHQAAEAADTNSSDSTN